MSSAGSSSLRVQSQQVLAIDILASDSNSGDKLPVLHQCFEPLWRSDLVSGKALPDCANAMYRIQFVVPRFHTNLWFAVRAMQTAGHTVEMLVNTGGGISEFSLLEPNVMGDSPDRGQVREAISSFNPDVMFIRHSYELSRHAAAIARRRHIPAFLYNLTPCDVSPSLRKQIMRLWKGLPRQRVTPSRRPGRNLELAKNTHFLPWPVGHLSSPDHIPPARVGRAERLRVLLIGKLGQPRKNHLRLIEAIKASDLGDRILLTLAGAMPEQDSAYYQTLLRFARSEAWIDISGEHRFEDMQSLFAVHDVCILPSNDEPLGVAPIEGMAHRLIPIISAESGSSGYITNGEDGFVVDPNNLSSAVAAMDRLVSEPALLESMRDRAYKTYKQELSESKFVENLSDLLKKVLE